MNIGQCGLQLGLSTSLFAMQQSITARDLLIKVETNV